MINHMSNQYDDSAENILANSKLDVAITSISEYQTDDAKGSATKNSQSFIKIFEGDGKSPIDSSEKTTNRRATIMACSPINNEV